MTDADLKTQLAALPVPGPDDDTRARALHRATIALNATPSPAANPRLRPLTWHFAALALPVLLVGFILGARDTKHPATDPAVESRQLLAQLNQLFPGQLNAVFDDNGTLQIDLAKTAAPNALADQAVVIELRREGRLLRIIAYSGRPVDIAVDGLWLRIDALITAEGGVLLATDDFVWSSNQPASGALHGWQIAAHSLAASS